MNDHDHHEHAQEQAYETTALERAREAMENDPDFIDLVDTNFHRNGLLYPADSLSRALAAYPRHRPYAPDPRGSPAAREAIAAYYRERGLDVDPTQIIITASASEGYNLVFNRMLEHGQAVSLPRPVYPLFEFIAEFNHLGVETLNRQGMTLRKQNRLEEAIGLYQRALKLHPESQHLLYNLAIALVNQNQIAKAKKKLERALDLDPHFAQAQHLLNKLAFLHEEER